MSSSVQKALEFKWGDENTVFSLTTDCAQLHRRASEVLDRWALQGPVGGTTLSWSAMRENGGYKLNPPAESKNFPQEYQLQDCHYSEPEITLLNLEFQAVAALVGRPDSPLHMHGALLAKGGRGIALIGPKEAGKSTLATYLWMRGYELLSDDGFYYTNEELVRPVPRRARLRPGAKTILSPDFTPKDLPEHHHPYQQKDGCYVFMPATRTREVKLETVVVLTPEAGPLRPLDSAEATLKSVVHTNSFRIHGLNATLAKLSGMLPDYRCYTLGRATLPDQFERLNNAI